MSFRLGIGYTFVVLSFFFFQLRDSIKFLLKMVKTWWVPGPLCAEPSDQAVVQQTVRRPRQPNKRSLLVKRHQQGTRCTWSRLNYIFVFQQIAVVISSSFLKKQKNPKHQGGFDTLSKENISYQLASRRACSGMLINSHLLMLLFRCGVHGNSWPEKLNEGGVC